MDSVRLWSIASTFFFLIIIKFDTSVHHSKKMCGMKVPGLYVKGKGHMTRSNKIKKS